MTSPRDEGGPERRPGQSDPRSAGGYDGEDRGDGSRPAADDGRGGSAPWGPYGDQGAPPAPGGGGRHAGRDEPGRGQGGYGEPTVQYGVPAARPGGQAGYDGRAAGEVGHGGRGDQAGYGGPPPGQGGYGAPAAQQGGYGGPPGYGQPGYGPPSGYGGPPAPQGAYGYGGPPPGGQHPYQGAGGGYAYNPYGAPPPAGVDGEPEPRAKRPGLMILALLMMILTALPFLLGGIAVLVIPLDLSRLPPELLNNPQLTQAGATPELLISAFRVVGVVLIVIAAVYLLLAFLAFAGRNWARILVSVLSVGFALLLAAGLVQAGFGTDNLLVIGIPLLLLVLSVVIMFLPASNAWYTRRR